MSSRIIVNRSKTYQKASRARGMANRSMRRSVLPYGSVPRGVIGSGTQWKYVTRLLPTGATNASYMPANLVSSAAANIYSSFSFRIQDIPDYTAIQSVWDQYRIDRVSVTFTPMNSLQAPLASVGFSPLWTAIDYDDSVTPTSVSQVMQYSNALMLTAGQRPLVRSWKPKYRGLAYNGSAGIQSTVLGGFLDLAAGDIEHYGLKTVVQQSTSTNLTGFYISIKMEVTFKKLR